MRNYYNKLPDLVIPNGTDASNIFSASTHYEPSIGLSLISPGTLPESVYWEVNQDINATSSSSGWVPYETFDSTGTSINLFVPGAGKAQVYQEVVFFGAIRLRSGSNVGAARTFQVGQVWTT